MNRELGKPTLGYKLRMFWQDFREIAPMFGVILLMGYLFAMGTIGIIWVAAQVLR